MTKPFLGKVVVTLLVNLSSGCQDIRHTLLSWMLTGGPINDDFNKTSPLKFEVNPLKILVSFFLDNVWNKR